MSKILRKTAKIFGLDAGLNQIAQFGSLAASAPAFTTDPAVIQSLSNYLDGWFSAIIGSNSPAIEDMNALFYLFAYQIAYALQAGIPEYDSGTTYYIGSLANSGGTTYVSLTNSNVGNPLNDGINWGAPPEMGAMTVNTAPTGITIPTGNTMLWPNLIIQTGQTFLVSTGATLLGVGSITVSGTGVLTVAGTGLVQFLAT